MQAPDVPAQALAALARQAHAGAIIPVGAGTPAAYRFPEIAESPELIHAARKAGCDAGFVPEYRRLDRVRVVAMDMDSTLITIECVDEIADMKGIKLEVAAITASAMRGEIDLRKVCAAASRVTRRPPVSVLDQVYEDRLRISPGATRMLAGFEAAGATLAPLGGLQRSSPNA
jgi:phosphoserine phosphatase